MFLHIAVLSTNTINQNTQYGKKKVFLGGGWVGLSFIMSEVMIMLLCFKMGHGNVGSLFSSSSLLQNLVLQEPSLITAYLVSVHHVL